MDFASSNLFSAEDTNTILENEYHDAGTLVPRNHQNSQQTQILIGVPLQSDECVALLIKKECEHMPCGDYLEKLANGEFGFAERGEILDWMYKVCFDDFVRILFYGLIWLFLDSCFD